MQIFQCLQKATDRAVSELQVQWPSVSFVKTCSLLSRCSMMMLMLMTTMPLLGSHYHYCDH